MRAVAASRLRLGDPGFDRGVIASGDPESSVAMMPWRRAEPTSANRNQSTQFALKIRFTPFKLMPWSSGRA
jgi:phosphodiesterase/alkaline phosphatase D-like protein